MEVSEQIIKVLDNLGQKFGIAVDWTQTNIVPYLQELSQKVINYEIWTSAVTMLFEIILAIVLGFALKKTIKESCTKREGYYDDNFWWILLSLLISIVIGVDILKIIGEILNIVTCLTLPEKILMDYVQQYMIK